MYESIERVFQAVVNYGILLLEAVGVVIILLTAARAVCGLLKGQDDVRLT